MNLFNPTKDEVREFFCNSWKKHQAHSVLTPMESIAARWIVEHPEYQPILLDLEQAKALDYTPEKGQTNPFLHLSMHMSLTEQIQANQPLGIREIAHALRDKLASEHDAQHQMMECLGQVIWSAQRQGTMPDMQAYLDSLKALL
jgi:hypothetical protein